MAGLVERPMRADPELDVIRKRGFEHEQRYLADLEAGGRTRQTDRARRLDRGRRRPAPRRRRPRRSRRWRPARTSSTRRRSSTARGAATPTSCSASTTPSGRRSGADFHYEVADTKLARHVKASAVLQICSYVDQLERIQGVRPEWLHVVLGGSARAVERLRVDDYMAYYRGARDRFLAAVARRPARRVPAARDVPGAGRSLRRLSLGRRMRRQRRRDDDHLSLVAGISARQRRALAERGIATLEALGDLELPMDPAARGDVGGCPDAGPRAGAHPARGPARAPAAATSCCAATRASRTRRSAVSPRSRRRRRVTCSSTSKATRMRSRTASTTSSVCSTIDGTFHAIWSRDADGRVLAPGRTHGVRAA